MLKWIGLVFVIVGYLVYVELRPESLVQVIEATCEYSPVEEVSSIEREWDRISFAVQGLYYVDQGSAQLTEKDAKALALSLEKNESYSLESNDGHYFWRKHIVGRKLGICSVNLESNILEYTYNWW